MTSYSSLGRKVPMPRGTGPKPTPRRKSSTDPTPEQRTAVYERAQMRCERCGDTDGPYAVHHRLTRKRGGGNELSNLALVCDVFAGSCHTDHIHGQPFLATTEGWLIPTRGHPSSVPLFYRGAWVLLDDFGNTLPTPDPLTEEQQHG